MWNYERRLQYPVNITSPNAKIAQIILSQYGGPDGEAAASFRYLSQRYSMPDRKVAGLLTDIGTEELAHLEMVASIVRQLTKGLSAEELEEALGAPHPELEWVHPCGDAVFWSFDRQKYQKTNWWPRTAQEPAREWITIRTAGTVRKLAVL